MHAAWMLWSELVNSTSRNSMQGVKSRKDGVYCNVLNTGTAIYNDRTSVRRS